MTTHESEEAGATPAEKRASRWQIALPALAFGLVFAGVLLTLWASGLLEKIYDKDAVRAWVASKGALAPLAYLGFLMLRPFTLVPSTLFAPVAFALFGITQGALLKALGESCGASLAFLASRHGLRNVIARRRAPDASGAAQEASFRARLAQMGEERGLRTVLALRFNLLIPFDAVNYGLGLTRVSLTHFYVGTLVGILPGTFLYVAIAGSALEGKFWRLAFTLAALALMVWLSIPLARDLLASSRVEQAEDLVASRAEQAEDVDQRR